MKTLLRLATLIGLISAFPIVVAAQQSVHVSAAQNGQTFHVTIGTELIFNFGGGLVSTDNAVVEEISSQPGAITFKAIENGTVRVAFSCTPGPGATCGTPFAVTIVVGTQPAEPPTGADAGSLTAAVLIMLGACALAVARFVIPRS